MGSTKKGVLFLSCLMAICMVGCNSGEPKKEKVDSVVAISLGDWLSDDSITELCRVTNVPTRAKVLYSNGYDRLENNRENSKIITSEKKRSVGEMFSKDNIFVAFEYDLNSGDLDMASYSVSDSWSKIKDDEEFTKYSDTVVYDVEGPDRLNIYMCLDEESDKFLSINATFNKTKMDDNAKVKMLLGGVDILEKESKENQSNDSKGEEDKDTEAISQKDLEETFSEKYDKVTGDAEKSE